MPGFPTVHMENCSEDFNDYIEDINEEEFEKSVNEHARFMEEHERFMEEHARFKEEHARNMEQHARNMEQHARNMEQLARDKEYINQVWMYLAKGGEIEDSERYCQRKKEQTKYLLSLLLLKKELIEGKSEKEMSSATLELFYALKAKKYSCDGIGK
ncbi:hypothetical protein ACSBR2_000458 [Camellia fascicularis]